MSREPSYGEWIEAGDNRRNAAEENKHRRWEDCGEPQLLTLLPEHYLGRSLTYTMHPEREQLLEKAIAAISGRAGETPVGGPRTYKVGPKADDTITFSFSVRPNSPAALVVLQLAVRQLRQLSPI